MQKQGGTKMKKWSLLALLLAMLLVLAACGSDESEEGSTGGEGGTEGETYTVGIDTTYPPFEFEVDGEYTGIDIDLIKAIAEN